jgi:hypothetical protein
MATASPTPTSSPKPLKPARLRLATEAKKKMAQAQIGSKKPIVTLASIHKG